MQPSNQHGLLVSCYGICSLKVTTVLKEESMLPFLCVCVLELDHVDEVGLELTNIHLPLPPECWIKGVYHHRPLTDTFFPLTDTSHN